MTIYNDFARSTEEVLADGALPDPGGVFWRETTVALSKRMQVEQRKMADAIQVSDDWGGWRRERYDALERLAGIHDAAGNVLAIERDSQGRITRIYLGEVGLLEYTYDAEGWVSKKVTDLPSGEVVFHETRTVLPGEYTQRLQEVRTRPRPAVRAYLPGRASPVIEWDEAFSPGGAMVATLASLPYALVPLDGQGEIWRSYTPTLGQHLQERIDYTLDEIVLHLQFDAGGPDTAPHTVALRFGRTVSSESSGSGTTTAGEEAWSPAVGALAGRESLGPAVTTPVLQHCGDPNVGCWCLTREIGDGLNSGLYIEIRCPAPLAAPEPPAVAPAPPPNRPVAPGMILAREQRLTVNNGKREALNALKNQKSCSDLFCRLVQEDGTKIISDTEYRNGEGARNHEGKKPCDEGAAAWTYVGARWVLICDSFTRLTVTEAGVRIIHEALHSAGLKESPAYPNAPTEEEINSMIRDACF